jgi:hypothetical protein
MPDKVPIKPVWCPSASRASLRMCVVVVLPFVPVTPMTSRLRLGWLKKVAAMWAVAVRVSSTITCATGPCSSVSPSSNS